MNPYQRACAPEIIDITDQYRKAMKEAHCSLPKTIEKFGHIYTVEIHERAYTLCERVKRVGKAIFFCVFSLGLWLFFSSHIKELFTRKKELQVLGRKQAELIDLSDDGSLPGQAIQRTSNPKDIDSAELSDTEWLDSFRHIAPYMFLLSKTHPGLLYHPAAIEASHLCATPQTSPKIMKTIITDLQKHRTDKQVFAYLILIQESHYAMVLINRNNRSIKFFNSFGNQSLIDLDPLTKAITAQDDPAKGDYSYEHVVSKAIQMDDYQCGAWVLFFLENELTNNQLLKEYNKSNYALAPQEASEIIQRYRQKIQKHLAPLDCRTLYRASCTEEQLTRHFFSKTTP